MASNHAQSAVRALRAVVWDMGGVLVRNLAPEPRIQLAEKYGISEQQLEELVFGNPVSAKASLGQASVEDLWNYVATTLNIDRQDLPAFVTAFWSSDRLDEVLLDFIESLRVRYKTGLLSNAFADTRPSVTVRFPRLLKVFDVSLFSAEEGLVKPDPRFYRLMLDRLGIHAEEAIFVDDFTENVAGAEAVGMKAVHFKNPQQARQAVLEKLSDHGAE
jgi:epoxide hydrolase-like predicted phosphatase